MVHHNRTRNNAGCACCDSNGYLDDHLSGQLNVHLEHRRNHFPVSRSNQGQTLLAKGGQERKSKLVFGLSSLFTLNNMKKIEDQLRTYTRLFGEPLRSVRKKSKTASSSRSLSFLSINSPDGRIT